MTTSITRTAFVFLTAFAALLCFGTFSAQSSYNASQSRGPTQPPMVTVSMQSNTVTANSTDIIDGVTSYQNDEIALSMNGNVVNVDWGRVEFNAGSLKAGTYSVQACDLSVNFCSPIRMLTVSERQNTNVPPVFGTNATSAQSTQTAAQAAAPAAQNSASGVGIQTMFPILIGVAIAVVIGYAAAIRRVDGGKGK